MAVAAGTVALDMIYEGHSLMVSLILIKKKLLSKNTFNSRVELNEQRGGGSSVFELLVRGGSCNF